MRLSFPLGDGSFRLQRGSFSICSTCAFAAGSFISGAITDLRTHGLEAFCSAPGRQNGERKPFGRRPG